MTDTELFKDYLKHLITGTFLVLVLVLVSIGLEYAAEELGHYKNLWKVTLLLKILSDLVLIFDAGSLIFFLSVRTYRFVRGTWDLGKD